MAVNLQENKTGELSKKEKSELVQKATELLLSKERKGWGDGEKKNETFQSLASKFGLSERTIANTYYKLVMPTVTEENEKKSKRTATLQLVKNDKNEIKEEENKVENAENSDSKPKQTELTLENEDKKEEPKAVSVTPSQQNYAKKVELDYLGRPMKPPYKTNDIIEVRVDHIREFGVFCYTFDEYEYKGLIHISEIKDIFVDDANDYFEAGDIIKVKVLLAQPNRLTFSTKGLKVPLKPKTKEENNVADTTPKNPPINSIGEQFGKQLQSKLQTYQVTKPKGNQFKNEVDEILKEDDAKIDKAEIEALFAEQLKEEEERLKAEEKANSKNEVSTTTQSELLPTRVNERDVADVQTFLNNKIGALSPNAQHKLVQILDKQGMFKSTMAISKVADDFVVDYGLIFMEMVARELEKDECL